MEYASDVSRKRDYEPSLTDTSLNDHLNFLSPTLNPAELDNDALSVSSKNLRLMMLQKGDQVDGGSNVSLAPTSQNGYSGQNTGASTPRDESTDPESISRPLSRSSTTSCLSTTATKDGVEGKRHRRYGHTSYFNNVLSNMLQQQHFDDSPRLASPVPKEHDVYFDHDRDPTPLAKDEH